MKDKIEAINNISKSFCAAKWTQVTIDLVHGMTHSCHHPERHEIPLAELKENLSALHNTKFKQEQRLKMLNGERPPECSYCWDIEDCGNDNISDRHIKSTDPWSIDQYDKILEQQSGENFAPTYVEVMFNKTCNFACSYCMGDISSSITNEIKKFGPYKVKAKNHRDLDKSLTTKNKDIFISAFWKWLKKISPSLQVLRITGGEPLLSKETFNLIDFIKKNPQPNLTLSINTNLGVPLEKITNLIEGIKELKLTKSIKRVELYTSCDTYGKAAEYIRPGLKYEDFWRNLSRVDSELAFNQIVIMGTLSIYSAQSFSLFLKDLSYYKKKFNNLSIDFSLLKDPEYMQINLLPLSNLKKIEAAIASETKSFTNYENSKLNRIISFWKNNISCTEDRDYQLKIIDFHTFTNEFSRRYNYNFLEVFPDLKEFYIYAKKTKFLFPINHQH